LDGERRKLVGMGAQQLRNQSGCGSAITGDEGGDSAT
jgi:hypothetical protein